MLADTPVPCQRGTCTRVSPSRYSETVARELRLRGARQRYQPACERGRGGLPFTSGQVIDPCGSGDRPRDRWETGRANYVQPRRLRRGVPPPALANQHGIAAPAVDAAARRRQTAVRPQRRPSRMFEHAAPGTHRAHGGGAAGRVLRHVAEVPPGRARRVRHHRPGTRIALRVARPGPQLRYAVHVPIDSVAPHVQRRDRRRRHQPGRTRRRLKREGNLGTGDRRGSAPLAMGRDPAASRAVHVPDPRRVEVLAAPAASPHEDGPTGGVRPGGRVASPPPRSISQVARSRSVSNL